MKWSSEAYMMRNARVPTALAAVRRPVRGFSLIELMIAVAVVAILAAVAIPSYSTYIKRGKRAEAKTALVQAAQFLERNYSQAGCYNFPDPASCTAGAGIAVVLPAMASATDYAIPTPPLASQTYTLSATPCGVAGNCASGSVFTDPDCGVLTLDNTGTKGALGANTLTATGATLAAIQQCWQR
jgi:type IV pilus assembly protein PilE